MKALRNHLGVVLVRDEGPLVRGAGGNDKEGAGQVRRLGITPIKGTGTLVDQYSNIFRVLRAGDRKAKQVGGG